MQALASVVDVQRDGEGYLLVAEDWSDGLAAALAAEEGIPELGEGHWAVVRHIRDVVVAQGQQITLRKLNESGVVTTKELYALFPGKPLKKAAKIAGVPKPASCV